ncbi:MAG: hypothetical protein WCF65_04055 [Parachlamydiaceae bacterium]
MTPIQHVVNTVSYVVFTPIRVVSYVLRNLWQKVSRVAESIFSCFRNFHSEWSGFSTREISLLRDDRLPKKTGPHTLLNHKPIQAKVPIKAGTTRGATYSEGPPYITFDSSLEELRSFFRDFGKLLSDEIYDHCLAAPVRAIQENEELVDKAFEHTLALLVNEKVHHYSTTLEKTVQLRLGEIVREATKINAGRIADFFSERLATSITTASFPDIFDKVVHDVITNHIQGIIHSDQHASEHRALLTNVQEAAKIVPINDSQLESKTKALKHLHSVERHGGDRVFIEHMALEKFSQQPTCQAPIKKMIRQEIDLTLQGEDPHLAQKNSELLLYEDIADKLLTLLAPIERNVGEEGNVEDIDPFETLWNTLYFPEEFESIVEHFTELANELVRPETTKQLAGLKIPVLGLAKTIFISKARALAKKHLMNIVHQGFQRITTKVNLDELTAKSFIPTTNINLIKFVMRRELGLRPEEFSLLFHQLISNEESDRPNILATLQEKLIGSAKKQFHYFNPDTFQNSQWLQMAQDTILMCEQEILNAKINQSPIDLETITVIDVLAILKHYFSHTPARTDPAFGDIVRNLVFHIGDMSYAYEQGYSFFLQGIVSTSVTDSTEDMRTSHDYLTGLTANLLKESFLSPEWINMIFSDESVPQDPNTEQQLAEQIRLTSTIVHDIFMSSVEQSSFVKKYAVKKALTDSPDRINELITQIYHRLFKREFLNMNLITNCCDVFIEALSARSQVV